jgi:hypothetical protein
MRALPVVGPKQRAPSVQLSGPESVRRQHAPALTYTYATFASINYFRPIGRAQNETSTISFVPCICMYLRIK